MSKWPRASTPSVANPTNSLSARTSHGCMSAGFCLGGRPPAHSARRALAASGAAEVRRPGSATFTAPFPSSVMLAKGPSRETYPCCRDSGRLAAQVSLERPVPQEALHPRLGIYVRSVFLDVADHVKSQPGG